MGVNRNFEKDFKEAIQFFPKLNYQKNDKEKMWVVSGDLDICDQIGDYWETFSVAIYLSYAYPYCTPHVREISKIVKRDDDWHINDEGFCCLDIEHRMILMAKRGIKLSSFIKDKVYPYFANQIFKKNDGEYAAGEYRHGFDGVVQFYKEDLKIENIKNAILILQRLISNKLPGRNDCCICGERKKYKFCHMREIELLRSLPPEILKKDLEEFSKLAVSIEDSV